MEEAKEINDETAKKVEPPTKDNFVSYLYAVIPEGYPLKSIPLSFHMKDAERKELVFQQNSFLDVASNYIEERPWISYLASLKHIALMEIQDISTASLREFVDKEYFVSVETKAKGILTTSKSHMDSKEVGLQTEEEGR